MNLTIFSNSTGYNCIDGNSYIEILNEQYCTQGRWIDGLNVFDVRRELPNILCGRERKVILHLGAVEAFSYPSENFLSLCINYLLRNPDDFLFLSMMLPKMITATDALAHKENKFFSILSPEEFRSMLRIILTFGPGSKILLMGMGEPNCEGKT